MQRGGADSLCFVGERITIRPWHRRKDRAIANGWVEPSLPAHWSLVASVEPRRSFAIVASHGLVGRLTLRGQCEIGIYIAPRDRGKGYGKEALHVFMRNAGGDFVLEVATDNQQALRCYLSAGFVATEVIQRPNGFYYQQLRKNAWSS
jgi:RimJ/RimL family protein N-acetyltransferase